MLPAARSGAGLSTRFVPASAASMHCWPVPAAMVWVRLPRPPTKSGRLRCAAIWTAPSTVLGPAYRCWSSGAAASSCSVPSPRWPPAHRCAVIPLPSTRCSGSTAPWRGTTAHWVCAPSPGRRGNAAVDGAFRRRPRRRLRPGDRRCTAASPGQRRGNCQCLPFPDQRRGVDHHRGQHRCRWWLQHRRCTDIGLRPPGRCLMGTQFDFTGQTVLVTGGAQGIGRGIVEGFAASGARVLIADLQIEPAQALARELQGNGCEAQALGIDLADEVAIAALLGGLERLDILVHNAGYFPLTPFADITPAILQRTLAVNLSALFSLTHR